MFSIFPAQARALMIDTVALITGCYSSVTWCLVLPLLLGSFIGHYTSPSEWESLVLEIFVTP